jgi:hypothetical protein
MKPGQEACSGARQMRCGQGRKGWPRALGGWTQTGYWREQVEGRQCWTAVPGPGLRGSGLVRDEGYAYLCYFNVIKATFDARIGGGDRTGFLDCGCANHEDSKGAVRIKHRTAEEQDATGILLLPVSEVLVHQRSLGLSHVLDEGSAWRNEAKEPGFGRRCGGCDGGGSTGRRRGLGNERRHG